MWGWLCIACWVCAGAPDWPENGEADREWVEAALDWRLRRGVEDCPDRTVAMDALTLRWLAESREVVVRLETGDWPEVQASPELLRPLAQILLRAELAGDMDDPDDPDDVLRAQRRLRKVARRSRDLWRPELAAAFRTHREALKASDGGDQQTGEATGEHQEDQGG